MQVSIVFSTFCILMEKAHEIIRYEFRACFLFVCLTEPFSPHLILTPNQLSKAKKEDSLYSGSLTVTDTPHGVYICWDRDQSLQQHVSLSLDKSPSDMAFRSLSTFL
jgi:hypothetical protein